MLLYTCASAEGMVECVSETEVRSSVSQSPVKAGVPLGLEGGFGGEGER